MADTGWVAAGAGATVSPGDNAWADPSRITSNDGLDSTVVFPANSTTTEYLYGDSFSFSITNGDQIDGIEAGIERRRVFATGKPLNDNTVSLVNASATRVGDNKAVGPEWSNDEPAAIQVYGGASDTWNASPTEAMVEDPDFGLQMSADFGSGSGQVAEVDYFEMKIYHSTPTGGGASPAWISSLGSWW